VEREAAQGARRDRHGCCLGRVRVGDLGRGGRWGTWDSEEGGGRAGEGVRVQRVADSGP
jgi:hypothetical protein